MRSQRNTLLTATFQVYLQFLWTSTQSSGSSEQAPKVAPKVEVLSEWVSIKRLNKIFFHILSFS